MADVFVSYKHATYSAEAGRLTELLEERHGLSCYLDIREDLANVSDEELREHLASAIAQATIVAFFETYREAVVALVAQAGGKPIAQSTSNRPSWQEWELSQSTTERCLVLYHSAQPRALQLGIHGRVSPYSDLAEAASLAAQFVQSLGP